MPETSLHGTGNVINQKEGNFQDLYIRLPG